MIFVHTLLLLAYKFNAITKTGDYAHIQVLTKINQSTINKTSLKGHFLRKTVKRKVLKQSYSIGQIHYWICSILVFVAQNAEYYSEILQIRQWNKSNSKVDKYFRTVFSTFRLYVFFSLKNCLSMEIFEMVE